MYGAETSSFLLGIKCVLLPYKEMVSICCPQAHSWWSCSSRSRPECYTHSATYFLNFTYFYEEVNLEFFQEVFLYFIEAYCYNSPSPGKPDVSLTATTET